jgi:hypothetical protein
MANHKHRDIRYKGFIISLDYDRGDYVGIDPGWVYNVSKESTGLDHGSSDSRMPFREAVREAKMTIDEIITEVEEFEADKAEFSGNDEDYLREEEDPCTTEQ